LHAEVVTGKTLAKPYLTRRTASPHSLGTGVAVAGDRAAFGRRGHGLEDARSHQPYADRGSWSGCLRRARDVAATGAGVTQSQLRDLCLPAARGNSGQFRRRALRPWCAALARVDRPSVTR